MAWTKEAVAARSARTLKNTLLRAVREGFTHVSFRDADGHPVTGEIGPVLGGFHELADWPVEAEDVDGLGLFRRREVRLDAPGGSVVFVLTGPDRSSKVHVDGNLLIGSTD